MAEFVLWELSIVSSLSLYSILVQHACNDRAWLTYHFHINYDLNLETAERSTQGTNANYMWPRDFQEKMPATAEFRLGPQRGVALLPRDIYTDRQKFCIVD